MPLTARRGLPLAGEPMSACTSPIIGRLPSSVTVTGRWTVGLSTDEVTATTTSLILIFGVVTLAALLVAAVAGAVVVRIALRPLGRVAATATRVSELPLDKGEVALAERVEGAQIDRDERKGKGASDHAPVIVDLD